MKLILLSKSSCILDQTSQISQISLMEDTILTRQQLMQRIKQIAQELTV
jgi:hypothetical protein